MPPALCWKSSSVLRAPTLKPRTALSSGLVGPHTSRRLNQIHAPNCTCTMQSVIRIKPQSHNCKEHRSQTRLNHILIEDYLLTSFPICRGGLGRASVLLPSMSHSPQSRRSYHSAPNRGGSAPTTLFREPNGLREAPHTSSKARPGVNRNSASCTSSRETSWQRSSCWS